MLTILKTLLGIVILLADIYAILTITQTTTNLIQKTVWIAVILLFPMLGVIVWYFIGPGGQGN